LVASAALVALAALVVLVALAVLVVLAALVAATVPRLYRLVATAGSTIRSIAAAPRIETGRPRTGLAVRRAETPCPIARLAPGSNLAARGAIWPAIGLAVVASATGPVAASAIVLPEEPAPATGLSGADRIASEAGTSLAAAAEIAMPSEAAPGDITDRTLAAAAAAAPPAWDLEAEASAVVVEVSGVVVGGAGKRAGLRNTIHRSTE